VKLLQGLDAFRRPQRLRQFLLVCEADYRGRQDFQSRPYPQAAGLWTLYLAASQATPPASSPAKEGWLQGEAIRRARVKRVAEAMGEPAFRSASAAEPVENAETGDVGADGGAQGAQKEDQQGA